MVILVFKKTIYALTFVFTFTLGNGAVADTLEEMLARTYQNNPDILAAQSTLEQTLEETPVAWTNYLPSVSLSNSFSRTLTDDEYASTSTKADDRSTTLSVSQDLLNFSSNEQFNKAKYNILRQRELFRGTVQKVLLDAITAYLDVIKNENIVQLRKNNVAVLETHLKSTEALYELRRRTNADLSQAQSRLAKGNADLTTSEIDYNIAASKYRRITGLDPNNLSQPVFDIMIPYRLQDAMEMALVSHPNVVSAFKSVDAAKSDIRTKKTAFAPTLSLSGSVSKSHTNNMASASDESVTSSVGLELTIPIFQKGVEYTDLRIAEMALKKAMADMDSARRVAEDNAAQSWEEMRGAKAKIEAFEVQVNAATIALKGISQELEAGRRTLLNLLDAEQELLNARVSLAGANHDYLLAKYKLAERVGELSLDNLKIGLAN